MELLQKPMDIPLSEVNQLKELVHQFPYFNSARMLYAKALKDSNNMLFEAELRKAAIYVTDRKLLHEFMHQNNRKEITFPAFTESNSQPSEPVSDEVDADSTIQSSTEIQYQQKESEEIEKTDLQKIINERLEELQPETKTNTMSAETSPVEKQDDFDNAHKTIIEPLVSSEQNSFIASSTSMEDTDAPSPKSNALPDLPKSMSFMEWIRFVNAGMHLHTANTNQEEELIRDQEKKPVKIKPEKTGNEKEILISRFIDSNPRIDPSKSKFYSPVDMARNSVIENEEIVSETLAAIYAKQGNISKAIRSYEILSLKYPDKKAYFAGLISELKK